MERIKPPMTTPPKDAWYFADKAIQGAKFGKRHEDDENDAKDARDAANRDRSEKEEACG